MKHIDRNSLKHFTVCLLLSLIGTYGVAIAIGASFTKEYILNEAKAIKSQCEQLLSSIDDTKAKLEKCNKTISELDDVYREKQENDARLSKLEKMMQSLLDKLA